MVPECFGVTSLTLVSEDAVSKGHGLLLEELSEAFAQKRQPLRCRYPGRCAGEARNLLALTIHCAERRVPGRRGSSSYQASLVSGKTALAHAIADQAKRIGFGVGFGKAEEHDGIAPMAPLLEALRSGTQPLLSATDFAELAPLSGQQLWLVDRLTSKLEERALHSPVLVAIDDVHWADRLSVFALRIAPGRLAGSPIVWLLATRPHPEYAAREIVAALSRDVFIDSITLGPLHASAIDELALDVRGARPSGRLKELLQEAGGYPFLAVELLDGYVRDDVHFDARSFDFTNAVGGGRDVLPAQLISAVRRRLESLPEETLQLVQVASILGGSFAIEDAAALLSVAESSLVSTLQIAVGAGVLVDRGGHASFQHDLFRAAVYEDISPSKRLVLHRAAAERLLSGARNRTLDAVPHVVAYARFGDGKAAHVLRLAAAAIVSAMPLVAAELIKRAFSLVGNDDPVWLETGQEAVAILAAAHRTQDAVAIADHLLETPLSDEIAAQIQTSVGRILWTAGDVDGMRRRIDGALARGNVSERARAELQALDALAMSGTQEWATAASAGDRALGTARAVGGPHAEADALRALGEAARLNGYNEAALENFRALRVLVPTTFPIDEIISLQLLDRYDESRKVLEQARIQSEARHDNSKALPIAYAQMWHDRGLGRFNEAEAEARSLLQLCEELQERSYFYNAQLVLCRIAQLRGDVPAARARLASLQRTAEPQDESVRLRLSTMRAWLAENDDDAAVALAAVRGPFGALQSGGQLWRWSAHWLMTATRIAVRGGDLQLAREAVTMARVLGERNPNVTTVTGIAMHVDGLVRADVDVLRSAFGILRASPRPLVRGDAAVDLGCAELDAGRREEALRTFDDAWKIFRRVGAEGKARNVARLMEGAGARRHRWSTRTARPLEGWAALTETEQRVARLVADGHTNRSAAVALALSPNTVTTHLRSIFGKLSVSSRSQLTRAVIEQG